MFRQALARSEQLDRCFDIPPPQNQRTKEEIRVQFYLSCIKNMRSAEIPLYLCCSLCGCPMDQPHVVLYLNKLYAVNSSVISFMLPLTNWHSEAEWLSFCTLQKVSNLWFYASCCWYQGCQLPASPCRPHQLQERKIFNSRECSVANLNSLFSWIFPFPYIW